MEHSALNTARGISVCGITVRGARCTEHGAGNISKQNNGAKYQYTDNDALHTAHGISICRITTRYTWRVKSQYAEYLCMENETKYLEKKATDGIRTRVNHLGKVVRNHYATVAYISELITFQKFAQHI